MNVEAATVAWLPLHMPRPGILVEHRRFGPARLVASNARAYDLEQFISPWHREPLVADPDEVRRLRVPDQTRVYVETEERWRCGRVVASDGDVRGYEYVVQFPNQELGTFSEQRLFVRSWRDHADPTASLALGAMETQFWHEHRLRFGSVLAKQRAACRGLTGIISARVELVPHQVDVARRVLEDQVQRYLLADEVGMGKTIEAGFVIRQFLLSEETGDVWVVAPRSLLQQWRSELADKFCVEQFPERVHLFASDDHGFPEGDAPELLVVDEAHHLVTSEIADWFDALARRAPRIVLLSATPSLRDPSVLLRLLRLIDPPSYADVSLDVFRERLARQEDVGNFIRGLRADANPVIIRQRLRRLSELFPGDDEAVRLGERVATALEGSPGGDIETTVRMLRAHVADLYRTHQRLVRSRRRDCPDWVFLRRGPEPHDDGDVDWEHVQRIAVEDGRLKECFEFFEDWRIETAALHPPGSASRDQARDVYCRLFEAFGSGAPAFAEELARTSPLWMSAEWRSHFERALQSPDTSAPSRSQQIAVEIKRRLQSLARENRARPPKVVVFGCSDTDLDACASSLAESLGRRAVLDARVAAPEVDVAARFHDDREALVLVCGRVHEEGVNLHFADALVHLDLPLAPQRVEQRIGRLDRFGRRHGIVDQFVVLAALPESRNPWAGWLDVLARGFHVFNEPIADLQFMLEDARALVSDALFEQGAMGVRSTLADLRLLVRRERDALDNQYALDRVLQEEDEAREFFEELDEADGDDREVDEAVRGWLGRCVQLRATSTGCPTTTYSWSDRTLLPRWPWLARFKGALDEPQAARRSAALSPTSARRPQVLRIGSPLMIAAEAEYRWDDRGTAFATLRVVDDVDFADFLAFKLCYFISARLPDRLSRAESTGLRARLDGLLRPRYQVVYVDPNLNPIDDPRILEMLGAPYRSCETGGRDYNLGSRQDALYGHIDALRFEALCRRVRETSEQMLRAEESFVSAVAEAVERGRAYFDIRLRRLRQKPSAGVAERARVARQVELYEAALLTLADPDVTLDGIGAIVLTNRAPGAA